jgi:2-polyprenyl-3-methyl-5-hydroxy-6-metoxy-1,4-benzoquinol methylase
LPQIDETSLRQQRPQETAKRQESVRIGNLIVLAQPDKAALDRYKQQLRDQSYQVSETEHFVICQKPSSHRTILIHSLGQIEINADIIRYIEKELPAFGIIGSEKTFGALLFVVLAATFSAPRDQLTIWRRFCLNTLNSLRDSIGHPDRITSTSYIGPFSAIYKRIFELFTGQSLLDVGCSFGFLPILLAERYPQVPITGCDNNPDAITISTDLAVATNAHSVTFRLLDVLAEDFPKSEDFDTVTAIHLLEHLTEQNVPVALTHLLQVTDKRLIVAVPYEEEAQGLYGHQQIFTPEKLQYWGNWCIEQLKGNGRYWCEEVMGGMLIIDRSTKGR